VQAAHRVVQQTNFDPGFGRAARRSSKSQPHLVGVDDEELEVECDAGPASMAVSISSNCFVRVGEDRHLVGVGGGQRADGRGRAGQLVVAASSVSFAWRGFRPAGGVEHAVGKMVLFYFSAPGD